CRTFRSVRLFSRGAFKPALQCTRVRTTVSGHSIAVVASFAVVHIAVTTRRRTILRHTVCITTNRLLGAGLGTAAAVSIEQPVLVAFVTGFTDLDVAVAADRRHTGTKTVRAT